MTVIFNFLLDLVFTTLSSFFLIMYALLVKSLEINEGEFLESQALMPNGMLANFFNIFIPGGSGGASETAYVPLMKIIMVLAVFIASILLMWNIVKPMLTRSDKVEHPFKVGFMYSVTLLLISFSYRIADMIVSIGSWIYSAFTVANVAAMNDFGQGHDILTSIKNVFAWDGILGEIANIGTTIALVQLGAVAGIALGFIGLFLLFSLVSAYVKYILEFFERYILLGVICLFAPLMFACLVSVNTARYFWSWFQMLITQTIILCMSIFFLSVFYQAMTNYEKIGNPFVFIFLLMAWLRVGTRMDAHLSTLGLTTGQSGGMASDIIAGWYGANQMGKSMMPKDARGNDQTFGQAFRNEARVGLFGKKNGALNADATGPRSTFAGKALGKQFDKAAKEGRTINTLDVGKKAIPNALREGKAISHVGEQMKNYMGLQDENFKATNGGVDEKGNMWLSGENENGDAVRVNARQLNEGEALKPGEVEMRGENGERLAATITGDGANEFLTGTKVTDGSQSAQDVMDAFGGENSLQMTHASGAVDEGISGQDLLNKDLEEGEYVVTDKNGNQHVVSGDVQFGEMTGDGFVAEGETFMASNGQIPMNLQENGDGTLSQSFSETAKSEVTAGAAGFIDKEGNFVQMSKSEFSQASLMSTENASNTQSLIKDTNGNYQKLAGGSIQTNDIGQVAVVGANGESKFVTPHESAVNRDASGNIQSYNTASAFVQTGGKDGSVAVEKGWKSVAQSGVSGVTSDMGVRLDSGTVEQLSENSISNGQLQRFNAAGHASANGAYVKTMQNGKEVLSRMDSSEGGQVYRPTYSVAGGIETNELGQFDISKIQSVQSTKQGTAIAFNNGDVAMTHVASGIAPQTSQYSSAGNLATVQTGRAGSYFENTSNLGSLSNLSALQNPKSLETGTPITLAKESDRNYVLSNMSSHSFLTDKSGRNIKAMHVNPETGVLNIREHNQAGYMLLPKTAYNRPMDAISDVNIGSSGYYVVKTSEASQNQLNAKNWSQMFVKDNNGVAVTENAMVFNSDIVGHGQKGTAVREALENMGKGSLDKVVEYAANNGMSISPEDKKQFNYNLTDAYGLVGEFRQAERQYTSSRKTVGEAFRQVFDNGSSKKDPFREQVSSSALKHFKK